MGNSHSKRKKKQEKGQTQSGAGATVNPEYGSEHSGSNTGFKQAHAECPVMPKEFMEQAFSANDIMAIDTLTARPFSAQDLGQLAALREYMSSSPYFRGGVSPVVLCERLQLRMAMLAHQDSLDRGAGHALVARVGGAGRSLGTERLKSDEISRDQLLYLIWRLLHTSGETQWQAMVYLFHDDAAASTRPSSHAEKFLESHQTAQMLSMLTLLAVENACALLPPETATAFQSRYAGNIGHASIAAWIAQNQIGARVTGGVLARWAAECTCEDWAGVLGERLLLRALAAHEGGQMPMAVQGTDDDGGGAAAARAHSSCSPARVPPAPERAGVGEMEEASTGDSMVYGMVAGLMPVLDVRSNILSAEAVFALRPWLPGGGAQGLRRLYSSQADGHSLVRLGHCVNGYKGETLMLFKDELQRVVAILNHQPWRDSPMFQGDKRTLLMTLSPRFSCVGMLSTDRGQPEGKGNYLYNNASKGPGLSKAKGGVWPVRGLGAGGGAGKLRLAVDENLEGIRWQGARMCDTFQGGGCEWSPEEGQISVCEVWALGGSDEAQEAQEHYRMRQMKMIQRARQVDRAAMFGMSNRREDGGWDANADKWMLDMAGITSANSDDYRR